MTSWIFTIYFGGGASNSLNFARGYTEITDSDLEIILASRRSILKYNDANWVKKYNESFDVPMGAFNSAQIADVVGIYILDTLSRIVNLNQVGLYRDDGLIFVPSSNGPITSSLHKKVVRAFKYLGLKIEISSNLKIVNFLDITLNLSNDTFRPFHKLDQTPLYINIHSNHPKSVIEHIPKTANTRINKLSSNHRIFEENKFTYNQALRNSGFRQELKFNRELTNQNIKNRTKHRKRKVIWFNPPYSKLSKIDIGSFFLRLVDKHFHNKHPLHKIFNRKTLKVSYSCVNNIDKIISSHNCRILKNYHNNVTQTSDPTCSCRNKDLCPIGGKCMYKNVVYEATIFPEENRNEKKRYIGISAGDWKQRLYSHRHSFRHRYLQKPNVSIQTLLGSGG